MLQNVTEDKAATYRDSNTHRLPSSRAETNLRVVIPSAAWSNQVNQRLLTALYQPFPLFHQHWSDVMWSRRGGILFMSVSETQVLSKQ